ncbi:hypothetical protein MASR1M45_07890 [Candidatus Kapaibacterium sp.]
MKDIYQEINYDELTDDIRIIADVTGIDNVRMMLKHLGGLSFYIPKITAFNKFIQRYADTNSDKTLKEIAISLNVSEQYLRKMLPKDKSR